MDELSQHEQETQIDLREYWNKILKRKWIILTSFIVAVVIVAVYTLRQTKIYEAKSSVIIEPYAPQVLGNVREVYNLGAGSYWSNKEYYETQYNIITSRVVSQKVVQLLRLENNKEFLGIDALTPEEQKQALDGEIDYVEMVRRSLEVEPLKDSRAVYIKARHRYPKWAQRLADAAVNGYIDYNRQTRQQVSQDAAGWLASQATEIKTRMYESEQQLVEFKKKNQMLSVSLEDRQNITSQRLQDLNQTLNRVKAERITLEARRKQILDIRDARLPLDVIDEVIDNKLIQQLKETYFNLKEQQAELSEKYHSAYPKVVLVEKKLNLVKSSMDQEIGKVLSGLETEYKTKLENERSLQRELAKVKVEAQEINEKEVNYNRLKRVSDNYSSLYDLVLKRQKEATLASHQETNNVYKLDTAVMPKSPVYPNVRLNILLAAVVGLLGGIGLVFFLEYLDNTIKNQEDVEKYLQVPFLGVVPSIKLEETPEGRTAVSMRDQYLIDHPKSSVAECCRTVRTNLLFMTPEEPSRKILVTSASPQEGKSTMVVNLGIIMAQSGTRTLLVDTDMRRPRLHKSFGISGNVGLTTVILGETSIDEGLRTTKVANLDVFPCGPIPPNPTELFHTDRFAKLVEQLSKRYDRVIFDSPPMMMVADPLILSRMMDGVIMVLKGSGTNRDVAKRSLKNLRDVNAKILGVIINDLDLHSREYGYYYYRRYGYYYGEREGGASAG